MTLERKARTLLGERLRGLKQQIVSVPGKGLGYGILRYLKGSGRLDEAIDTEIAFNYLGQFDERRDRGGERILELSGESSGRQEHFEEQRQYLLEISGAVRENRLHLWCTYSHQIHHRETVMRLLDDMVGTLRKLMHENVSAIRKRSGKRELTSKELALLAKESSVHERPEQTTVKD
jgi:non-ribosomal peptide synthase protein (TIGR01720 family)